LLVQTSSPELSENTVLKIGATDKETEVILNYMTAPVHLPDNKRAYLGVMQVSLLPGWRTKKGYIGEVQVSFQFALSKHGLIQYLENSTTINKNEIPSTNDLPPWILSTESVAGDFGLPQGQVPTVISAFPFEEAQILDLASSMQRQISFLLQLAASIPQVPGLQASLQQTFSKLVLQQLQTRNALPLVVPSSQGADVTYRFDPELQALVEPSSSKSGPGHVLEPSSFPALIVISATRQSF
jgi:hypothetical protein